LSDCKAIKPILTCYPRPFDPKNPELDEKITVAMCFKGFAADGLPRFKSRPLTNLKGKLDRPFQSLFWAAGFSFSAGNLLYECGYTNEVDDVFFGEELFQMMKFYDMGWQLFSPQENLIYHLWERDYRPTFAQESKTQNKQR